MSEKPQLSSFRESLQSFQEYLQPDGQLDRYAETLAQKLTENKANRLRLVTLLESCNTDEFEEKILEELRRINADSSRKSKQLIALHSSLTMISSLQSKTTMKIF